MNARLTHLHCVHSSLCILATVLEEPELEADMVAEDQDKGTVQEEDEAEANGGEEASQTPTRRGWVRRSVASSGTHHSTELIEVQVPDHPAITMDCCVQVMEQSFHYTVILK